MLIMFLIVTLKQNDHFFNVFLFVQFQKGIIIKYFERIF